MLTKDALARLWPRAAPALIDAMVAGAEAALPRFSVNTPLRLAMLLAMATVESMAGTRLAENLDYSAARLREVWPRRFSAVSARLVAGHPEATAEKVYGGRLGNRPGTRDAFVYRGGGLPQLTGRDTYAAIGALLGLDLVGSPDLARDPAHALDVLCAFFAWKDLGDAADRGDVARVTHRWSGGLDSLVQREAAYRAALSALGVEAPAAAAGTDGVAMGAEGYEVEAVQKRLGVLGYHCGAADGHFGSLTRAALLAFQADNHLPTTGVADPATKTALAGDNPRLVTDDRAHATPATLASLGSATVLASRQIQKAAVVAIGAGGVFGTGSATGSIDGVKGLVDKANGLRDTVTAVQDMAGFVGAHWWAVAIVAGALLYGRASTIIAARVADHQAAANLGT